MRFLTYLFITVFSISILVSAGTIIYVISYHGRDLPDYSQLKDYQLSTLRSPDTGDRRLIAEIDAIPNHVKNAFIAAEDPNFYTRESKDYFLTSLGVFMKTIMGSKPKGASTITYQVAQIFLWTHKISHGAYKIRVALLAFRMEKAMSKDRLLELYLNEVYLGEDCYGVAAGALNYFNKPVGDLTLVEAAYLAGLPKAPNLYNHEHDADKAKKRRDWVIGRMEIDGYITAREAEAAIDKPLVVVRAKNTESSPR